MARLLRLCIPGIPQHIIQRGVNRQACFAAEEDFTAYTHWLQECAVKYRVAIHAWVFMTNHVHLLVTPKDKQSTSRMMQTLGRYYVRYFNQTYRRKERTKVAMTYRPTTRYLNSSGDTFFDLYISCGMM